MLCEEKEDVAKFKDFKVSNGNAEGADANGVKGESNEDDGKKPEQDDKKNTESKNIQEKDTQSSGKLKASPLAKAIAKKENIDLTKLTGSGPGGRIVKSDLESLNRHVKTPEKSIQAARQIPERVKYTDTPLTLMRQTIADRLSMSTQTIPHYYLTMSDIKIGKLMKAREELNVKLEPRRMKLSLNDFILKAVAMALRQNPSVNAEWTGQGTIRQYETIDLAFAVATETGLITPVLRDADKMGLLELSTQAQALTLKAKSNKLALDEYTSGTFTVSNLGMFGITNFTAIINPPQAAILAVGGINATTRELSVTLSCDHRVIDGAVGAEWMRTLRAYLEEPFELLL